MLTIIIPVQQSKIKPDCFLRLLANCFRLKNNKNFNKKFTVLIADCSFVLARPLISFIASSLSCYYQHISLENSSFYSPAVIKNKAAQYCFNNISASHVLFLDVDVLVSDEFIEGVLEQIMQRIDFDWYPVHFLSSQYKLKQMFHCINNEVLLNVDLNNVIQTGYVTGLQLISREMFKKSGGYVEEFVGYGCEDIEFIHRATLMTGVRSVIESDSVYYTDDRGYDVEKLKGFRNFYYQLKSQKNSQSKESTPCHFWHIRKNKSNYLKSRKNNDDKLLDIMKDFDDKWF